MAVVTSAVIAAVGTAYSISANEQAKNQQRLAGQKADREKSKMEQDQKNQKAIQKAEAARDTAYARQQGGGGGSDNLLSGDVNAGAAGVSAETSTKKIGDTPSGKTLLGV